MTDTALLLKKYYDAKMDLSDEQIDELLQQSVLVSRLTKEYEESTFFNIFRVICLSEIPFSERLPYTQKLMKYISEKVATPQGFSYTGRIDYIVPCYNALLLEAYVRLGYVDSLEVKNALNWIKKYQIFARGETTEWRNVGICKHGGCMRTTPCYIGIGKTVRALVAYAECTNRKDNEVEQRIGKGIGYMLQHKMYQRLSNQEPISPHITDIMFPQAYMLSLTDLVYIATKRELWSDDRTDGLKKLLQQKMVQPLFSNIY